MEVVAGWQLDCSGELKKSEKTNRKHIIVNKLDRHRLEKHPQKSLDADKGWETEGVTLVPETIHRMWLV